MRRKPYIFRKKSREKGSSWALFLSFCGLLVLTPPAIAQGPGLQPVHHREQLKSIHHGN